MNDLKPCPFCGGKLNFYRGNYVNRFGKRIIEQYWMHDDTDCVLNDINQYVSGRWRHGELETAAGRR